MARAPASFGAGFLSIGLANLIGPVPAGQKWYLTKLDLFNTHSGAVTVTLYTKPSGTAYQWKTVELAADGGSVEIMDKALEMEAGAIVMAQLTQPNAVTFTASGVIES